MWIGKSNFGRVGAPDPERTYRAFAERTQLQPFSLKHWDAIREARAIWLAYHNSKAISSLKRDLYSQWGKRRLMGYWLVISTSNYHPYLMTLLYLLYCNYILYPSQLNFSRTDTIAVKLSYILLMNFRCLYLGNLTEILDSKNIPNYFTCTFQPSTNSLHPLVSMDSTFDLGVKQQ